MDIFSVCQHGISTSLNYNFFISVLSSYERGLYTYEFNTHSICANQQQQKEEMFREKKR